MAKKLFGDVFSKSAQTIGNGGVNVAKTYEKKELNFFNPKVPTTGEQVYKCYLKFIPYYKEDGTKINELLSKTTFLTAPNATDLKGSKMIIRSGEQDRISEVCSALKRSPDPIKQKLAEKLYSQDIIYTLVHIVDNQTEPSLNGKTLIWRVPYYVHTLILDQVNKYHNDPWSFIDGCPFELKIVNELKKNGKVGPTYMQSRFVTADEVSSIPSLMYIQYINPAISETEPQTFNPNVDVEDEAKSEAFMNWLLNEKYIPRLSDYEYKEWDKETVEYIENTLSMYLNMSQMGQNLGYAQGTYQNTAPRNQIYPPMDNIAFNTPQTPHAGSESGMPFGTPQQPAQSFAPTYQKPSAPKPSTPSGGVNVDDVLAEFGI